jgi:hypothetical protein
MFFSCQVGYSTETLTLEDLPSSGETLVINSDSILTVNVGETAAIDSAFLYVNGTDSTITQLEIVNNGELIIKSTQINCNHANFTIQNTGTLTFETSHFTVKGNATLMVSNEGQCLMTDTSLDVYGGYAYLRNTGSLVVENGYFKDQFDGTYITNYGNANMSECTFVANGADGKVEIFNSGDCQFHHSTFDVNYGGKLNINTLTGTLTVTECSMDISGASHGQKSSANILAANATWDTCSFVNNDGNINYLNTGEVSLTDCTVDNFGVNATTILSSSGPIVFEKTHFAGSGSTSITNWDSITFIDSNLTSSHSLTLMNNAELTAENWLVKTTSSTARIVIYNGNNGSITFNVSFIEKVTSSILTSIGTEGQEIVESSGGTITITNEGSITEQSDSSLIYILAIVTGIIVVIIIFWVMRKKLFKSTGS